MVAAHIEMVMPIKQVRVRIIGLVIAIISDLIKVSFMQRIVAQRSFTSSN